MDYEKEAKGLRDLIAEARQYSRTTSPYDIFLTAESIIGTLAYLITPLMEAETAYRQIRATLIAGGESAASAEAKAKATEEYQKWRKLDLLYKLGEEQIKLLKKFQTNIEMEYKRS
jgi:hypothetical protein